jgi:hypothetical protein
MAFSSKIMYSSYPLSIIVIGEGTLDKGNTTRNFVFCNLFYATKKCRMQLHMLHATPK